jgi:hypothetical protein
MMPRTLPTYLHYIGVQHNLIYDIVFVELRRESQQNILFHIYLYIYVHLYDNMWYQTIKSISPQLSETALLGSFALPILVLSTKFE